jgi:hypothetical protein
MGAVRPSMGFFSIGFRAIPRTMSLAISWNSLAVIAMA